MAAEVTPPEPGRRDKEAAGRLYSFAGIR